MRRGLCGYIARHDPRQRRWHPWISRDSSVGVFFWMSKITIRNHYEITRILKRASQWLPQIGIHNFGCPDFCELFFVGPSVVHDDDFFGGNYVAEINEFPPQKKTCCFFFLGDFRGGHGFPGSPWPPCLFRLGTTKPVRSFRCLGSHRIIYRISGFH